MTLSKLVLIAVAVCSLSSARAQQAVTPAPQTVDPKASALLQQSIAALGGDAWLHRDTYILTGRSASFYKNMPNLGVMPFIRYHKAVPGTAGLDRYELSKKRDVLEIWTEDQGWEVTFKGHKPLPKEIVEDHFRRQAHSFDEVVRTWIHDPSAILTYDGTTLVGRRQADKITVINSKNDAVVIELDTTTHLPLRVSYTWRNATYKDLDNAATEFEDYHLFNGIQTPLSVTNYLNGDMITQQYVTRAEYNTPIEDSYFNPLLPYTIKFKK